MTAGVVVGGILLGIAILCVIWYNGKNYGERKVQAETIQVGADTAAEHTKQLEVARAKDNEAARQKDLDEALAVGSDSDAALDFLVHSHKDGSSPGPR